MSTAFAPADWSSRPVPTALSPERLAALVGRSIARSDGMLFTATPTEELEAIGRWQRLKDQAFAGQMREIVAAYNRAGAREREFAADEVGLVIGATSTTGGHLVAQALALAALPGLLEAVEAGQLTERHVLAVLGELDRVELTLEQRQVVVLVMLARYTGQAPGELGRLVARLIVEVDRAAAAARDAKATRGRQVWTTRDVDGQALLLARGPAAAIAAIRASLEATLAVDAEPGDDRSREAREFDLLVDLLTGGSEAGSWHAEVVVPFSVAQGGELELAEIPGLGPILPSTARQLLDQARQTSATAARTVAPMPDLVPYDPTWPDQFAQHRRDLEGVLAPWLTAGVHHIGSTSIPGCPAKPLLDMMAGVGRLDPAAAEPLSALGYVRGEHRPHEALWFSKPGAALHLTVPGSDLWRERLAFRDALRHDDDLRDRYAELKLQLAHSDLRMYTDLKRPFVAEVLASHGIELRRR